MFVEVKRLSDSRLYIKSGTKGAVEAEVIGQLKSYKDRLDKKFQQINSQYSNVVDYYNALSGGNIPRIIPNSKPLFGLLLVEFSRSARDQERKKAVQEMIARKILKCTPSEIQPMQQKILRLRQSTRHLNNFLNNHPVVAAVCYTVRKRDNRRMVLWQKKK